jgi:hypothetical protein
MVALAQHAATVRNSAIIKKNRKSDGSSQCNTCVVERDRNVCLEFSMFKFDEFDDPRHKGRVDGAAAWSSILS